MNLRLPLARLIWLCCAARHWAFAQDVPSSAQVRFVPHVVMGVGYVTKLTIANLVAAPNNVTVNFISQAER